MSEEKKWFDPNYQTAREWWDAHTWIIPTEKQLNILNKTLLYEAAKTAPFVGLNRGDE